MHRRHALAVLGSLGLFARSSRVHALTARPVTVDELTRASDEVIVGTVRRSESRWDDGAIVTDHEVELLAVLKGRLAPRGTVVVRVAGGTVGRVAQAVVGAPQLEDGRTYMLFLAGGISTARYLAHVSAAVVPVTVDPTNSPQTVVPTTLAMEGPAPSRAAARPSVVALDRLVARVRGVGP